PEVQLAISMSGDESAWMSGDGLRLVFASTRSGGLQLWEATRATRQVDFDAPTMLAPLSGAGQIGSPTLSPDALDIYFCSSRPGGPGGLDIYTAHRAAVDQPFAAPVLVPELSSPLDEWGIRLADDATMYLDYDTSYMGG